MADNLPDRHISRLIEERRSDGSVWPHKLSVVEIEKDENGSPIGYRILPYEREIPFTVWHDRPLAINPDFTIEEL